MTTDKSKSTTRSLSGLEPDNLLAFLALLGLLKALETARPEWKPKVSWQEKPPKAALILSCDDVARDILVKEVERGICELSKNYNFDKPNITFTNQEFRHLVKSAGGNKEKLVLFSALASDGAVKRYNDVVEPTPLCAMFGQGHQDFLSRLNAIVKGGENDNSQQLATALFYSWEYQDKTESFRWDPIEDRRYALQFGDPSDPQNKVGTVSGANRLAAIGFGTLASVPTTSGLSTLGVARRSREHEVCWPIVAAPTSLAGHLALLAHPSIGEEDKAPILAVYGVIGVARARRFQIGKFFNFERARVQFFNV